MKWIRWSGLIPFAVIVITTILFSWLLLDSLVKNLIESKGSELVGAKVELQSADVGLIPLRIKLNGLQVTDPDNVMRNMVVIDNIHFEMDSAQLLFGKVIVDEMTVAGVRINQARKTSGKLQTVIKEKKEKPAEKPRDETGNGEDTGIKLPDVQTVINKESKHLQAQQAQWKNDLAEVEQRWQKLQKGLPDAEKFADYKRRNNAIKSMPVGNVLEKTAKLKAQAKLYQEVQADLKRIQQARNTFKKDLQLLRNSYSQLRNAPSQDLDAIMEKYNISAEGSVNASQLLLGDSGDEWVEYGLKIYEYLAPMLFSDEAEVEEQKPARAEGRDIRFREYEPLPGFLIRKIYLSTELPSGRYQGNILNISSDQGIIGKPMTFELHGSELAHGEVAKVYGEFNRLDRKAPVDEIHYVMQGRKLTNHSYVSRPGLKIVFTEGQQNSSMDAFKRGSQLDINYRDNFSSLVYNNEAGSNKMSRLIAETMAEIPAFYMATRVQGQWKRPRIRINTDLDQKMSARLRQSYQEQINQYKKELRLALEEKNKQALADASAKLESLTQKLDQSMANAEEQLRDLGRQIKR
jgi:uncharacterized protein (TIGR03545 family)